MKVWYRTLGTTAIATSTFHPPCCLCRQYRPSPWGGTQWWSVPGSPRRSPPRGVRIPSLWKDRDDSEKVLSSPSRRPQRTGYGRQWSPWRWPRVSTSFKQVASIASSGEGVGGGMSSELKIIPFFNICMYRQLNVENNCQHLFENYAIVVWPWNYRRHRLILCIIGNSCVHSMVHPCGTLLCLLCSIFCI